MPIRATLQNIAALQELNEQIARAERKRRRLGTEVERAEQRLRAVQEELHTVGRQLIEVQKTADGYELKIREAEEETERLQAQLNVTRHQREYDLIRHTIASRRADIAKWEDEELAALESVDQLRQNRKGAEQEIERQKEVLNEVSERVAAEQQECDRQLEELEGQQEALRREIDDEVLAAYERIAGVRAGQGLAEVRDRVCQGCFTTVSKQTENLLMRDEKVIRCSSCGRILMLAD